MGLPRGQSCRPRAAWEGQQEAMGESLGPTRTQESSCLLTKRNGTRGGGRGREAMWGKGTPADLPSPGRELGEEWRR